MTALWHPLSHTVGRYEIHFGFFSRYGLQFNLVSAVVGEESKQKRNDEGISFISFHILPLVYMRTILIWCCNF